MKISVSPPCFLAALWEKEVFVWAATEMLRYTAGRQQWNYFLVETGALQEALLHPCLASSQWFQLQSSHALHWIRKGPSWCWSESGGSSCNGCPHVFETCCLPAETCDDCLQDATHAWWEAMGSVGCHGLPGPPSGLQVCKHAERTQPREPCCFKLNDTVLYICHEINLWALKASAIKNW